MRERAIETSEVQDAKERFQVGLARLARDTEKSRSGELEDLSEVAPHLIGRRR